MTLIDRLYRANHWYDRLSSREGGLVAIWAGLGIFAAALFLNFYLGLTLWALLLLGFGGLVATRLAYRLGKLDPADGVLPAEMRSTVRLPFAERMLATNLWFDAQTPLYRMCTTMGWLYGSFVLNLLLTHRLGFPFGLLFVGVAGVMLVGRVGYAHGWLGEAVPDESAHAPIAAPPTLQLPPAEAMVAMPAPVMTTATPDRVG